MIIKAVKVYQSIQFDKASESFFQALPYQTKSINNQPKVTLEEHERGILVHNEKDCVLICWANISYIQYDKSAKSDKPAKK